MSTTWIKAILTSLVAILLPIKPLMLAAGFLIMADMFFGMWAAKKREEKLTSAGMRRTVSKMLIFQSAIITGFICERYLLGDLFPISKLVAGVVGAVEMKSVLENMNVVYGEDLFKSVITKLGSVNDKNTK